MKLYRLTLDGIWLEDTIDHLEAKRIKDRYNLYCHEVEIIDVNFFYWLKIKIKDLRRKCDDRKRTA